MLRNHLFNDADSPRRLVDRPEAHQLGGAGIGSGVGGVLGLGGSIAVLAGAGGKGGKDEYKKALKVWEKLQTSDFDFRALDPPELRVLSEYMPEVYSAVVPEEFQSIQDSPGARDSQVRSLSQLEEIAGEGMPLVDRLQAAEAGRSVSSAAAASQRDSLRRLAARGALSSGDEIQAQVGAGQVGSNLARDLGSDVAQSAALRRLGAIGQAGGAAGQLRGADVDLNTRNAATANRFAELFSSMKTDEARENAAARQAASNANVARRQEVGDTNVLNRYGVGLENLNRQNLLRGSEFGQNLEKTRGLSEAYTGYGLTKDAEKSAKEQALMNLGSGFGG
jgi:hypothetical protein